MGAEKRIAEIDAMIAARTGANGLAIKGSVRNVEALHVERARLLRGGIRHPGDGIRQMADPSLDTRRLIPKQPPPRIAVPRTTTILTAAPTVVPQKPVFRPQTSGHRE